MSRRVARVLAATLAAGLTLSLASGALAAPVGALKQFKVPTANSQPRAITNGSDGNRWFTEGTEFTNAPPKIARITPAGAVTEISVDCNSCILTDIIQGPDNVLYFTSNNPFLGRYNWQTGAFLAPIDIPNSNAVAGDLAVHGDDIWFDDFNNDSLWRYNITAGQFTQFPVPEPSDVVVDSAGDVWFIAALEGSIDRLDPTTGVIQAFPVPELVPRQITIAADGQIWFTSRFTPQGVGRLDPATGVVTTFPTPSNPGPEGIAASPDGTVWFTQTTTGNIARIDNAGVITEAKIVKGSEPFAITVATNGDPWYTMMAATKIATLHLR
jgi:sugar lactone lactonase YvrE